MNRLRVVTRWVTADNNLFQLFVTVTGIAVCSALVHPHGAHGSGLAVLCLLVLNSILLATRLIPETVLPPRLQAPLLAFAAVAAAALMSLEHSGSSSLFGFFVAGHAGYRLAQREAVLVALLTSALCGSVLIFPIGSGHLHTPWYLGLMTGISVLVGISNRNHVDALRSARAAAEQAELAARSETRAETLAERGRIARDVHDVLAHSLAGVNMQLEMADALMESGDVSSARQATQRAQSLVREGLTEVQRTVRALREDALPLIDTLRAMLANTVEDEGALQILGTPRELPVRPTQAFVRSAQEALTNAHKYAPGARLRVTVRYDADHTALDVVNAAAPDGARPLAASGSGMGLVGMRERVALVGGTVQAGPVVDGEDAGGWQVQVVIPG